MSLDPKLSCHFLIIITSLAPLKWKFYNWMSRKEWKNNFTPEPWRCRDGDMTNKIQQDGKTKTKICRKKKEWKQNCIYNHYARINNWFCCFPYDKCILLSFLFRRLLIQKLEGGILKKLICWFHFRKISLLQWCREVINWKWDAA